MSETYKVQPCYSATCFAADPPSRFNDGFTAHYHNTQDHSDAVVVDRSTS